MRSVGSNDNERRDQSSHCMARTSDAVAPLFILITQTSYDIARSASEVHNAAESWRRRPAGESWLPRHGARSSRDRALVIERRPGHMPSAPDRLNHPDAQL